MDLPLPQRLSMTDLNAAVEVMSRAFFDDPLWTYLVPDEHRRRIILPNFFRTFIQLGIRNEEAYGIGEPLKGVAIWAIPDKSDGRVSHPTELGYLKLLFDPLFLSISSALPLFSEFDELQDLYAPGPHYYLSSIGIASEARGKGLASKLIRPFLALADDRSLSTYTETVKASNVGLYKHYGFTIMHRYEVPRTPLTIWSLLRPPKL